MMIVRMWVLWLAFFFWHLAIALLLLIFICCISFCSCVPLDMRSVCIGLLDFTMCACVCAFSICGRIRMVIMSCKMCCMWPMMTKLARSSPKFVPSYIYCEKISKRNGSAYCQRCQPCIFILRHLRHRQPPPPPPWQRQQRQHHLHPRQHLHHQHHLQFNRILYPHWMLFFPQRQPHLIHSPARLQSACHRQV